MRRLSSVGEVKKDDEDEENNSLLLNMSGISS
jgi:hypothetical protein